MSFGTDLILLLLFNLISNYNLFLAINFNTEFIANYTYHQSLVKSGRNVALSIIDMHF